MSAFYPHSCRRDYGWNVFSFDRCDGCVMAAVVTEAYDVEASAAICRTLRETRRLPAEREQRLEPLPEDLARVAKLARDGYEQLSGIVEAPMNELAALLGEAIDSPRMLEVRRIIGREIAKAML